MFMSFCSNKRVHALNKEKKTLEQTIVELKEDFNKKITELEIKLAVYESKFNEHDSKFDEHGSMITELKNEIHKTKQTENIKPKTFTIKTQLDDPELSISNAYRSFNDYV